MQTDRYCVQRDSKVSESGVQNKKREKLKARKARKVEKQGSKNILFNETPKSRSRVSKMVFVVVPSVSDGVLNPPSQREGTIPEQMSKMGEETNNRYVQRDSKVSE